MLVDGRIRERLLLLPAAAAATNKRRYGLSPDPHETTGSVVDIRRDEIRGDQEDNLEKDKEDNAQHQTFGIHHIPEKPNGLAPVEVSTHDGVERNHGRGQQRDVDSKGQGDQCRRSAR